MDGPKIGIYGLDTATKNINILQFIDQHSIAYRSKCGKMTVLSVLIRQMDRNVLLGFMDYHGYKLLLIVPSYCGLQSIARVSRRLGPSKAELRTISYA